MYCLPRGRYNWVLMKQFGQFNANMGAFFWNRCQTRDGDCVRVGLLAFGGQQRARPGPCRLPDQRIAPLASDPQSPCNLHLIGHNADLTHRNSNILAIPDNRQHKRTVAYRI